MLLLYFSTLAWSLPWADCLKIKEETKTASVRILGEHFPWWYNLGVAQVESGCRWRTSLDGHGSVGYFQLTPKFVDMYIKQVYPDYTKPYSAQHFYAFAAYLKLILVEPLWITYQRYNGGDFVLKECKRAGSDKWQDCKAHCKRGLVCTWKAETRCKQYKSACEINYSYSKKVYRVGTEYRTGEDRYRFW